MEDKAEKKKAKKERQRSARAQAVAAEAPNLGASSSAAQQLPSSAQRSSTASAELLAAEQKPSGPVQAGAPAEDPATQADGHLPAEPAETLPQLASGEGRRQGKGQVNLNRSGTMLPSRVQSAPAAQATSPGVPGSNSTAVSPGHQTSTDQATGEHVSALSSPAEHPESSASALCGSLSALGLQHPTHEVAFTAHQPQNWGSGRTTPGQHNDRGAQASSPVPGPAEEESWQEVRSGRRKPAAKPTAARAGKGRSGGQTLAETLPRPMAAPPKSPQQAHRLQAPPGFAAGPTQANIGEAVPQWPALHASPQRQPAQSPVHAAPAAMHHWPLLQASARPEPERIPEDPELAAVEAPQQNLYHDALLTDLLLQPQASSSSTEQQTVHIPSSLPYNVSIHISGECVLAGRCRDPSAIW